MTTSVTTWITAGVGAALVACIGVQTVRLANEQARHANTVVTYANERATAAQATQRAEVEQRGIYESRIKGKDDAIQAAQNLAATRGAALADARRTSDGLRTDLADYLARNSQAGGNPDAGPGSPAAIASSRLLGGLFEEADSFAGIVAGALAASRDAGNLCARQYESLTVDAVK